MASVLLIATRYDSVTRFFYRWANNLATTLAAANTISVLYGPSVTSAALLVTPGTDYIIFFGHGEPDRFIGQKGLLSLGSGPTLVDRITVSHLKGSQVYAVCCQSGIQLGPAYSYAFPSASFVAYSAPFGFSFPNAVDFESIVKQSAVDFVAGTPARTLHVNLEREWKTLADDFLNGGKKHRKDAFLAGYAAATNSLFASVNP